MGVDVQCWGRRRVSTSRGTVRWRKTAHVVSHVGNTDVASVDYHQVIANVSVSNQYLCWEELRLLHYLLQSRGHLERYTHSTRQSRHDFIKTES